MSQNACENFDSKFSSLSSSLPCDFCFPSHELLFVILKCGLSCQRETAECRAALPGPSSECVSKADPDRDPHGWDTWAMCGSWLETSIGNWFWSLQLYGKEVHMWQCFLSVLACSKFLDNEISVVSELVMTRNSSDASFHENPFALLCSSTVP